MTLTVKYNQWRMEQTENRLEKKREQLQALKEKKESGEVSPAKFAAKKAGLEQKIRFLDARVRMYRALVKTATQ